MSHFSEDYSEQNEEQFNIEMAEKVQQLKEVISGESSHYFGSHEIAEVIAHLGASGAYNTAWDGIRLGLQFHPASPDIKLNAAWIAAQQGQRSRASSLLQDVHLESFGDAGLYELAANVQAELGNHDMAISYCRSAIDLDSEHAEELLMNLAFQLVMADKKLEAVSVLKEVILLNPTNKFAQLEFRFVMQEEADATPLIEFYQYAIDNHSHTIELSLELADILYFSDLPEESLTTLEQYIRRGGTDVWAHLYKARALYQLGKNHQAEEVVDGLIARATKPPALLLCQLAHCLDDDNQEVDLKQIYLRALELDSDCIEAMIELADIYLDEESVDEGLKWLANAYRLSPESNAISSLYGMVAAQSGRTSEAIEAFERALSTGQYPPDVYMSFATVLFNHGKQSEAFAVLVEGLIVNDFEPAILYLMAWYKSLAKHTTEAKDFLYLAVQQDPEGIDEFISEYPEAESSPLISAFMKSGNI